MSEEFLDAIQFSRSKLRVTDLNLKDKQLEALYACYEGHDCVAVLPTGYGKSLIFQILPWLLQKKYKKSEAMIVIVVSPFNSIMQDQVVGLVEKGIKACYLNNTGLAAKTYEIAQGEEDGDPDDEFKELETPVYTEKSVSLASLKNGDYKLIYAHPETLMSNSVIGRMLRSKIYKEQVGCIAIDEVHLVADWGQQFRKNFQRWPASQRSKRGTLDH
ncbi:hypothetical protein SNE40_006099 [Patella caerulea]|uniref:Helicase ATP-binding domain-containing protein n=1 Tax=Patella caerulea TaxID=87958 RepID=A0AAN8K0C8_PATCE